MLVYLDRCLHSKYKLKIAFYEHIKIILDFDIVFWIKMRAMCVCVIDLIIYI